MDGSRSTPRPSGLPNSVWERLESILSRFEDAWRRGERPAIEDYLAAAHSERHAVSTIASQCSQLSGIGGIPPCGGSSRIERYGNT